MRDHRHIMLQQETTWRPKGSSATFLPNGLRQRPYLTMTGGRSKSNLTKNLNLVESHKDDHVVKPTYTTQATRILDVVATDCRRLECGNPPRGFLTQLSRPYDSDT